MVNQNQTNGTDRPSYNRRKHLKEADASSGTAITVSNLFPIDRYYDASQKVLNAFEVCFEKKKLDDAYVYGMRYSTFCVNEITKHDYFKSTKFHQKRVIMNEQVKQVIDKLEVVAHLMDEEELRKEAELKVKLMRQKEEETLRQQEKLEELQQRVSRQKHSVIAGNTAHAERVQDSALAKLQRLNGPVEPPAVNATGVTSMFLDDGKGSEFEEFQQDPDGLIASANDIPPPLLPPQTEDDPEHSAPPSYQDIVNYFGPSETQPSLVVEPNAPSNDRCKQQYKKVAPVPRSLSIRQYIADAQRARLRLQQERKILVSPLGTYQGRVRGSTNGCTVISATIASKHLETHGGVTDDHICNIIDKECTPLLRSIRNKLGLHGDSLIIPSDVHDHMVDNHLLFQHKFVGAAGGNVVDYEHLGELFSLLAGIPGETAHLKAGATFFFREHVVSILKFPTSPTEAVYDLVDSLPTCNGKGSRTRCMSLDALKIQMEWYTSHKFSDSNCAYIEKNRWNDSMADFDPRVFQAFVWADLPKPNN